MLLRLQLVSPDSNPKAPGNYVTTTTSYTFGALGNSPLCAKTTVVDPMGNSKESYKDVHDRIIAVVEHNGAAIATTYAYDPLGEITDVWDNKGNHTAVFYDEVGNRTEIDNPDSGNTIYNYDANGNLINKFTANHNKITYNYLFNRLIGIDYPNSLKTASVAYLYGAMNELYNRAGRIKQVTDESGTEWRYYGRLGEVLKEERMVNAHTPSMQNKKFTTEYVFDSFGRMTDMTYPDGEALHYGYDDGGLLKAAWGEKSGNRYDYINNLFYDEFGQRTRIEYGNNTTTNYTYDPLSRRLATLVTTLNAAQGNRQIQNLVYQYDLVGNVLNLTNSIAVPTNTALPAGPVSQTFGYDNLYQITSAQGGYTFGPGKQNNYTSSFFYDTIGNMTQKNQVNQIVQPGAATTLPKATNYVLNYGYMTSGSTKPHAVTETDDKIYTYDPAGNMTAWTSKTSGQNRNIIWNEENRVKEIDDNGKATYFLYDDGGERVVKRGQYGESVYINRFYTVHNGELGTKSIYAGETRVVSKLVKTPNTLTTNTTNTTSGSTVTTSITTTTPGIQGLDNGKGKKLGIIKRLPDGTTTGVNPPVEKDEFYYHGDHLGSSNMITDSYGAVYQHLEYFPYGESWIEEGGSHGGNLPGYKFTGKELDPETGLYYYGARYYDPVLSTWISTDPALIDYLDQKKLKILIMGDKGIYGKTNTAGANEFNTPQSDLYIKNDQLVTLAVYGSDKPGVYRPDNLGLYTYAWNRPTKIIDPLGLWSLSFDVYEIIGGGLTIGGGKDQPFFMSFRAGIGEGGGFNYDPEGTSPSNNPNSITDVGMTSYLGANVGPLEIPLLTTHLGISNLPGDVREPYASTSGPSKPTLNLGRKLLSPKNLTLKGGGYAAFEGTLYPENILPPNPIDLSNDNASNYAVDPELLLP